MSVYDQVANDFESKNKTTMDDRNGTQLRIMGRLKPGMNGGRGQACARRASGQFGKSVPSRAKGPDVHNGTGVAYFGKQQTRRLPAG